MSQTRDIATKKLLHSIEGRKIKKAKYYTNPGIDGGLEIEFADGSSVGIMIEDGVFVVQFFADELDEGEEKEVTLR